MSGEGPHTFVARGRGETYPNSCNVCLQDRDHQVHGSAARFPAQLTTERLATILSEEFERDSWGDVELDWLQMVAEGNYTADDAGHDQAESLGKVLDRVVARLKAELS